MRRYTLLLLLLCMHCIARGQTGFDYRYWFDNDYSTVRQGHSATGKWQVDAEMDGLSESLHAIHLQVVDSKGNESAPVTRFFLKTRDTSVKQGYYWFDGDRSAQQLSGQVQGVFTIDVAKLAEGFHTFYYQVVGKDGSLSAIVSRSFYKVVVPEAARYRCWVDDDPTTMTTGKYTGAPVLVDISQISEGYHIMRVQIEDVTPSAVVSRPFVKIPQTEGVEYLKCLCVVDDKLYKEENVSSAGGIINWNFDVSSLPQGFHRMQIQVITPSGAATSTYDAYFLRTTTDEEMADMKCVYAIDGNEFSTEAGRMNKGAFHCDLNVAHLSDGLHRIVYMLTNGKGVSTKAQTQFFIKTPVGGNGIVDYRYWLNDSTNQAHVIQLDKRTNPFKLITLLPVEKHPIRSSLFQFEVTDGKPTLYAKNDIHIRFYDAAGRFVDASEQYVDYQVAQEVEPVGELQTTQTFDKVAENAIRWYTMQVAPGDTAAFRVSQAATVQVFAPSGKEVFKTSESASVNWSGIHTWEDGIYYVAVHDVTGSRNTMTLEYMHMDKYDVVRQDVDLVGNGGCSTITLDGNGFRDLYAVDLFTAQGDSIHHIDIGHESDAQTSVTFDFSDATLGVYDAVFHFTTEDKVLHSFITVEEARDIELATTVTYPSTFLRGTSTTYTIKIENKGNMTAYLAPMELKLKVGSKENISQLLFDGYLSSLSVSEELLSDSIIEDVQQIINKYSDLSQFILFRDSVENIDYGVSFVFLNVPPNSTKQFTVTIKSSTVVDLTAYMTTEWYPLVINPSTPNYKRGRRRASAGEWLCCYRERIECIADIMATIVSKIKGIPPNIKCLTQFGNTVAQAVYDIGCSDGSDAKERFQNYAQSKGKALGGKLLANAIDCITSYIDDMIGPLRKKLRDPDYWQYHDEILSQIQELNQLRNNVINQLISGISTSISGLNCLTAFKTPIPNCPPNPGGGGGSSTPQPPADPNDIYGYLAESGSKFIADSVARVNYTIEFENDTTFAMASAHTIVIRDTLDSRYFDLKSFQPTAIRLGEHEVFLDETDITSEDGNTGFIKTIDVRPAINAIAQVEGTFKSGTGIAEWRFTSLDPMTMEPTNDLMQGILPVNYDGISGIGEVMFEIGMKQGKPDGAEIDNRASIVFDYEEPILTPTWTNIVDGTAPVSRVADVELSSDTTAVVSIKANDELSGVWRYDVYVQYGAGSAWWKAAENVPADTTATVKIYEGIDHGFYTVVTDSAGNVEQKTAAREFTLEVFGSQVDTSTKLQLAEGWNWMSQNQQKALSVEAVKPKARRILSQTEELFNDSRLGWSGDLEELQPTEMYKVQMDEAAQVQLSGLLFNAAFRSIPLREGWNWMGYPVAKTMTPTEALAKLEAEEGDVIIGQDGMAQYSDGKWTGTLTEMQPGQGYMYRSVSDKNVFLNATAQSSSRRAQSAAAGVWRSMPEGWTVDKRRYPNVMGAVIQLCQDGVAVDAGEWLVGAFCGDECRGVAQMVDDVLMMNIYGQGGEQLTFRVVHRESGELVGISEQETFRADLLGSIHQPYELNMGQLTGIVENEEMRNGGNEKWMYDLQGRKVKPQTAKGVYIVTDGNKSRTQKVVRK